MQSVVTGQAPITLKRKNNLRRKHIPGIYLQGASLRGRHTPPATRAQEGKECELEKEKSILDYKSKPAT